MSFKFRMDGSVFGTEVKNGNLIIHFGKTQIVEAFSFLKEDFPFDQTDYPMCNIMCYLKNSEVSLIMRFDGTVTKYNSDNVVIGMHRFDADVIMRHIVRIPICSVTYNAEDPKEHIPCNVYLEPGNNKWFVFECTVDPAPHTGLSEYNSDFANDINHGTRFFPRFVLSPNGEYIKDDESYTLNVDTPQISGYEPL